MLKHLTASALAVAAVLALSGVVFAGAWEDGIAAYQRSDYPTALTLWQPLAERGDARAENNLGLLYEKGLGVVQDYAIAADWYRKAAAHAARWRKRTWRIWLQTDSLSATAKLGRRNPRASRPKILFCPAAYGGFRLPAVRASMRQSCWPAPIQSKRRE